GFGWGMARLEMGGILSISNKDKKCLTKLVN
ncbi:unnamed protein product, partial [marine sediment metagenome]